MTNIIEVELKHPFPDWIENLIYRLKIWICVLVLLS